MSYAKNRVYRASSETDTTEQEMISGNNGKEEETQTAVERRSYRGDTRLGSRLEETLS